MAALRSLLLVFVLLLAPMALGQETTPILLQRTDAGDLSADVGEPGVARFNVFNLNPADDFYVTVSAKAPKLWKATLDTEPFFLQPRNATNVTVTLEPLEAPRTSATFEIVFTFVHTATGEVTRITETVDVKSGAPPRVLGLFENPMQAPFDTAYGTFALDMISWIAIGLASIVVGNWMIRLFMVRASSETARDIVHKLRRPVLYLVVLLGLAESFAVLPGNPLTIFISKFLIGIAVAVFGLYVMYRLLDAALLYYQREVAPRTATKMDDVLIPAFRKVGLVIVYAIGIVITLRKLGWDPTFIFAGAGIAGLVIAFAAQDTFSNLFSGIFLMLDRPFVEGDHIRLESGDDAIVESIGLRTTRLYSAQIHETIIVPNNQLATRRIINHSSPDRNYRISVDVGVSYSSDPRQVERILLEVARAHPLALKAGQFAPSVRFLDFQDSALLFSVRVFVEDFNMRTRVGSELRYGIMEAFEREDVEIPFPQRVVHMRNE